MYQKILAIVLFCGIMTANFLPGAEWKTELIQSEDAQPRTGTEMDTHFDIQNGGVMKISASYYTIGGTESRADLILNEGGTINIEEDGLLRTDGAGISLRMNGGTITSRILDDINANGGLSLRGNDLVDIYGGTVGVHRINLAAGGRTSTMNLHDGKVSVQCFDFGYGGGTGNLNIHGGEIRILKTGNNLDGTAEITMSGGEMYAGTLGGAKVFHMTQTGGTVTAGNVNLRGGGRLI